MAEEREEEKARASGAERKPAEGSGAGDRENWPSDDWDELDWKRIDWNEDGRPDEVLLDALAAEEAEWRETESARRSVVLEGGRRPVSGDVFVRGGAAPPAAREESQAETTRRSGIAYAAGLALFITVISFMGLGWLLDSWLGTRWWLIIGIVVGAVAGFTQFVRIITRLK